jgi:hypothetical protein
MDQHTRMATLAQFKAGELHALVATDVAARGLDIKSIKTVCGGCLCGGGGGGGGGELLTMESATTRFLTEGLREHQNILE